MEANGEDVLSEGVGIELAVLSGSLATLLGLSLLCRPFCKKAEKKKINKYIKEREAQRKELKKKLRYIMNSEPYTSYSYKDAETAVNNGAKFLAKPGAEDAIKSLEVAIKNLYLKICRIDLAYKYDKINTEFINSSNKIISNIKTDDDLIEVKNQKSLLVSINNITIMIDRVYDHVFEIDDVDDEHLIAYDVYCDCYGYLDNICKNIIIKPIKGDIHPKLSKFDKETSNKVNSMRKYTKKISK